MSDFIVAVTSVWHDSGIIVFSIGNAIMIFVGILLLYLAFVKEFEPLLLGPIAFGCILANLPTCRKTVLKKAFLPSFMRAFSLKFSRR